jgi:OmcA/MtrC family decaheme c-type cytochrome
VTLGRYTGSARAPPLAVLGLCVSLFACRQPLVGERMGEATATGTRIALEDASLDLFGSERHVVATFTVTYDDVPLRADEVLALAPRFTLAILRENPVDGFPAWESRLLTGAQVAKRLPPGGPGTPAALVLTNARQPGSEAAAALVDLGGGRFKYVFADPLTDFLAQDVLRVGVWLANAEEPTEWTTSTIDFRPSGAPVDPGEAELVLHRNCQNCHRLVESPEGATGVRICVTCHTWQHSDPDTIDPAALFTTVTPAAADPNPLELARMIHRIHRGKDFPTIHRSTWDGVSATTVPSPGGLPLPFLPNRPGAARSVPLPGRKYSVVGSDGSERVYARAVILTSFDPTLGVTQLLAEGPTFPRELRDCAVCHGEAAQADATKQRLSRRTCSGCHPEVWYEASSPAADPVRFPHAGGPQADDTKCEGCHVTGTPKLYAPIAEVHVPPARARRYNQPYAEIVKVEDLVPTRAPKVTFRLWDRVGPIVPSPIAPVPAYEPEGATTGYAGLEPAGASTSYVARTFKANASIIIKIIGPTVPDYARFSGVQLLSGSAGGNTDPATLTTSSGTDEYVYTFGSTIPAGTTGTFAVGMEVRRNLAPSGSSPPQWYDKAKDVFFWPYTAETVNESAENVIVYVNAASGRWPPQPGDAPAVPRRTVVALPKCLRCHDRIEYHGGQKHDPAWCVTCHTHDNTDLEKRFTPAGKLASGAVRIGGTFDGIEERSTHFKMTMHRIHAGGRTGGASLEGIAPFVIYYSKAYFFDGGFPNDLRNCTLCHEGKSYLVESIPAYAPASIANEQPTIRHVDGGVTHAAGEPALLPVQAACTGCHATGATFAHVASKTVDGVETCAQCHAKGAVSVDVAHGLAPPSGGVAASFSAILSEVLVPQCGACHGASGNAPRLDGTAAYDALLTGVSAQSGLLFVQPGAPEESYLVTKLRRDMPPGSPLAPADVAAIEAWIANGAPND